MIIDRETRRGFTAADVDALARTVYGEARGEPYPGKVAIAWVAVNRWGSEAAFAAPTIEATCRNPLGFPCWSENDPDRDRLRSVTLNSVSFRECMGAALAVLNGIDPDPTFGATHYYDPGCGARPDWAEGKPIALVIGGHAFFSDID